jgi:hypothetical protein
MLQQRHCRPSLIELIVITLAAAVVAGVALYDRIADGEQSTESSGSQPIVAATDGDWPPMLLILEEQGVLVKLHYQDERHWRTEVIRHPTSPDMQGYATIYDGQSYTQYVPNTVDATTNEPSVISDPVPGGIVVPARWLRPGFAASLEEERFTARSGERPEQVEYVKTYQQQCSTEVPPGMSSPPGVPEVCAANQAATFEVTERYVLSTDIVPPITLSATIEHDGAIVWQARVYDIDLAPPPLDLTQPASTR